jgi:thiol-disulfide isomerase/thioredoxin
MVQSGMQKLLAFTLILSFPCIASAQSAAAPVELACRWSAQLTAALPGVSESYQVPFELEIQRTPKGLQAALLNGSDRIDFSSAMQRQDEITLRLDQYDAALMAHCVSGAPVCTALAGEYVRQRGTSATHYAISARCPTQATPPTQGSQALALQFSIAADWQFSFTDSSGKVDSEPNAPAHFIQDASHVEGTIAPVSGDYGMLSGTLEDGKDGRVDLSRFDGIHALRLDGHFVSPDRIEGVFHIAPGHPLNFVAVRSSTLQGFDEAEHLTSVENPSEPFRFHGVNAAGATVTQDDAAFRGKVVLVDIFGSWCPNCHDEAGVLQWLYAKYHERGLEIVGLGYEYVDDSARSQRLIGIYRRKYSIGFPLLLAGTTDAGQIAKTLPQLRNFGAYPTTIFLDRHGRVRLIHAGFSGPATGRLEEIKQHFEQIIVKLLDER